MIGPSLMLFLIVFALVALSIAFGWNYIEAQKKKKVTEMLQTAVGEGQKPETKVLLERDEKEDALTQFLTKFNFHKKLEDRIQQAGQTKTVTALVIQMAITGGVLAVIGLRTNLLLYPWLSAVGLGAVGFVLPYLLLSRARAKRLKAFEEQFPEALDFMARAMRAGHAFSIALEMLAEETGPPLGQEFKKVHNEHSLGLPIETALGNLATRVPMLDVNFFVSAVLLQRETGGNLAEILTKLAFVIRERFKLKGQVKAASAHGRITGTILTLMPVALCFGLMIIAPTYLKSMVDDPDGRIMIVAVLIMMVIGHFVIRKIVNIKV